MHAGVSRLNIPPCPMMPAFPAILGKFPASAAAGARTAKPKENDAI